MLSFAESLFNDVSFAYTVQFSKKRKTIAIVITNDAKVKVISPARGVGAKYIENFVREKAPWVEKKLKEVSSTLKSKISIGSVNDGYVFYLGVKTKITPNPTTSKTSILDDGVINLGCKGYKNYENALKAFLRDECVKVFEQRLDHNFEIFNKVVPCQKPSLCIRSMKSRFGSLLKNYSSKYNKGEYNEGRTNNLGAKYGSNYNGNLTEQKSFEQSSIGTMFQGFKMQGKKLKEQFSLIQNSTKNQSKMTLSTFLIHCDINLIDYIITHELCHIKHSGHGKGFYSLFKTVMPNFALHKKSLNLFYRSLNV